MKSRLLNYPRLSLVFSLFALASTGLLTAQVSSVRTVGTTQTQTPDPDIFDGTMVENIQQQQQQQPRVVRVGQYSEGNSLEGMKNKVEGWNTPQQQAQGQGQQGQQQQGQQGQGQGQPGQQGQDQEEGQGGGGQEGEEGEGEQPGMGMPQASAQEIQNEQGQGQSGGQQGQQGQGGMQGPMNMPGGMGGGDSQSGGGGNNPLEVLAQITQSAKQSMSQRQGQQGQQGMEGLEAAEGEFGNNNMQVEAANVSQETLGQMEEAEQQTSASANRSAVGRQEQSRGTGSEVGDNIPSDI